MPYGKSNKEIQDSAFKLKSGNSPLFKMMGSSPAKHSNIDGKKHPRNAETGTEEASHQPTYAAHGLKHPDEGKETI